MIANFTRQLDQLRILATWSRGLLIGYIASSALLLVLAIVRFMETNSPEILVERPGEAAARAARLAIGLSATSALWLLTVLASIVMIAMWIYRANQNLRTLGFTGLNYSPAWATGSFFVPVANLIVPFRAMRELCNRSFGESEYQAYETVPDVSSWWSCFVAGNLLQGLFLFFRVISLLTPFFFTAPPMANLLLGLFASLLLMASAFFLYRIIDAVTAAQQSVTGIDVTFR